MNDRVKFYNMVRKFRLTPKKAMNYDYMLPNILADIAQQLSDINTTLKNIEVKVK